MKIVTDAAANLSPDKALELGVEVVPFRVTFMGRTYRDGVDILPEELYRLYTQFPDQFSETSQPSVGDFVSTYKKFAGEEIISIHISSGLSGAYSSAEHAARMLSDRLVTVIDSFTVGPALGWMVEVAAVGVKNNWPKDRLLEAVRQVRESTLTMATFTDLRYLIHSARINHLRSIFASALKIKPIIGMNAMDGRLCNLNIAMTLNQAVKKMAATAFNRFGEQKLRLQCMHGNNLPGVGLLREAVHGLLNAVEDRLVPVTLVLGAQAGPTVVGLAAAPQVLFDNFIL